MPEKDVHLMFKYYHMDFTFQKHKELLMALHKQDYAFKSFHQYVLEKDHLKHPFIMLRHDVEKHYAHALKFAEIQHDLGIVGTYFFRILPQCFRPEIVSQIAQLGHEVGYHYDDLSVCKGDYKKAIVRFTKNLNTLRSLAPVKTICMDGSPLSKYDNKDLWQAGKYAYADFDLLGEPYFDVDFDKVLYLTDTGRRWDGWKTSVRDKVPQQEDWIKQGYDFHSSDDIIAFLKQEKKSPREKNISIMLTFHPQRWTTGGLPWIKEWVWQNTKNQIKALI